MEHSTVAWLGRGAHGCEDEKIDVLLPHEAGHNQHRVAPIARIDDPGAICSGEEFAPPKLIGQRNVADRAYYFAALGFQYPADRPLTGPLLVDRIACPECQPIFVGPRMEAI